LHGRVLHLVEGLLALDVLGDFFEFRTLGLKGRLVGCQLISLLLLILIGQGELIKHVEPDDPTLALLKYLQALIYALIHLIPRILPVLLGPQNLILSQVSK
jgi:hypothetical protein